MLKIITSKKNKLAPLRLLLVLPFVLQIFAAVGLTGYLSLRNGQKAINNLADQLINKAGQQVDNHLDTYLALPHQINQLNADAIAARQLDPNSLKGSELYFWRQAKAFETITSVGYTLNDGRESCAGRWVKGLGLLLYEKPLPHVKASEYIADEKGSRAQLLQTYELDTLSVIAYKDAVKAGKPIWGRIQASDVSNIQFGKSSNTLQTQGTIDDINFDYYITASARYPVYDQRGNLLAVLMAELQLNNISEFLDKLQVSSTLR